MKNKTVFALAIVLVLSCLASGQDTGRTGRFTFTISGDTFFASCGTFDVYNDGAIVLSGMDLYDKSGNIVRTVQHALWVGQSRYYNAQDPSKFVLSGPGEGETDIIDSQDGIIMVSGPSYKIRIPGYGLVWAETGHLVYDLNSGLFLMNTGHNQLWDQDIAALCDYLK